MAVACPLQSYAQKKEKVVKYTVKPGETVLGIAHRHNTTLDHLLSLNPGLEADHVQADQQINVPFTKGQDDVSPSTTAKPVNPPVTTVSALGPKTITITVEQPPVVTYKDYTVKRKDTAYSIAKSNNITVEELVEANPAISADAKIKKGMKLRIPVKTYPPKQTFTGLRTISVSVILPLTGKNVENKRSVEFYRGMLMGIEELKNAGTNVVVSVFNEPASSESMAQTLTKVKAAQPDVVVGPLYPTHFADVAAFASKKTKVIVPFSSKVPQVDSHKELFVVNTPTAYEQTFAQDLFIANFKSETLVVFLESEGGNRKTFADALRQRLQTAGYSTVEARPGVTAAQIIKTLSGKKATKIVFVPNDDRDAALRNALAMRGEVAKALSGASISLVGYDTWLAAADGDLRHDIHAADTYVLTANYYYPYTMAAKTFSANYFKWFKTEFVESTPRMAPLGYDLSRNVIGAMATFGYDFAAQTPIEGTVAAEAPLQSDLRFRSLGSGSGYVSRSMWLVRFKPDMSIVKVKNNTK